eukprot:TRINITY_DN47210_c0_g1_i1.p1 TRINITY_DN47210_c0_g1~~TRINITY_DN47210_c0_g1_i1.p1  ORF type:complete len:620 (+),score=146.54 TRINITY_DN47210_c0_g1_i1:108-1862(+)
MRALPPLRVLVTVVLLLAALFCGTASWGAPDGGPYHAAPVVAASAAAADARQTGAAGAWQHPGSIARLASKATGRVPTRAETLGHEGDPCQQEQSCKFFADVLVIIHINPQRTEWVDHIVHFAALFVPHLVLFSVIPSSMVRNKTDEERYDRIELLWVGHGPTKVHMVDSHMQIYGDHHDLATAMRLWPGFRGYLAWEHEDALIAWWNIAAPGRFDKSRPWHQPIERRLVPGNTQECGAWFGKLPRGFVPTPLRRYRRSGQNCQFGGSVAASNNWQKAVPGVERIAAINSTDAARLLPGLTQGAVLYYTPAWARRKILQYSRVLWEGEVYNEFAVPLLLTAACDGTAPSLFTGLNVWPDPPGRYQSVLEWRWHWDFLHPVRAVGELWARVTHEARTRQIPPAERYAGIDAARPVIGRIKQEAPDPLWTGCFTCDEYPTDGPYRQERKGRFHSCSPGCSDPGSAVAPSARNGVVQVRRSGVIYPGELEHEGFWGVGTENVVMGRVERLMARDPLAPSPAPSYTNASEAAREAAAAHAAAVASVKAEAAAHGAPTAAPLPTARRARRRLKRSGGRAHAQEDAAAAP